MKILPNIILFKIGTKFKIGKFHYEIVKDYDDKWELKDYGKYGFKSLYYSKFDSFKKKTLETLYAQNKIEIIK